jgi:archaellum biogenesis protein FlaJ (TadC family)
MPMKKMAGAMVAGFVVQFAGLFLIHSVLLKQDYLDTASLWRTQEAMNARGWAMLLAILVYVVGAVLIYIRGVEAKPWFWQGLRFGILMALVVVVNSSLSGWVIMPVPHQLVVKWIVCEGILSVVLGLVVAAICQPKPSAV